MKDNLARLCATVGRSLQEAEERRERWRAQRELRRREAILDAVRFAAERFLSEAMGWEESVQTVLERLGEATGADRVYIYENYRGPGNELFNVQRHEWTAQQVAPGVAPGTRAAETGLAYELAVTGAPLPSRLQFVIVAGLGAVRDEADGCECAT